MDELELQTAVQIANEIIAQDDVIEQIAAVAADPVTAARQLRTLADAIMKLGGGTVRPRTRTIKGVPPAVKP